MKFDNTLLYHKVKMYIKNEIEKKAEDAKEVRIESEREMAESLGVSRFSVNKAISELAVEGYLIKRRGKGVFIPAREHLQQKQNNLNTVALILPDVNEYYYGAVSREIERVLFENGMNALLCLIGNDIKKEEKYLKDMRNTEIKGVIAAPYVNADDNHAIYRKIFNMGKPVVLINRIRESMRDMPHVIYDQGEGSYLGVCHLVECGKRNILFVGDIRASYLCQLRKRGYIKALNEGHIANGYELYIDEENFEQDLTKLIKTSKIDGVVAYNDINAIKVMNIVLSLGMKVPDDIAILGHDNSHFAEIASVPLTSVKFPKKVVADIALEMLLDISNGKSFELSRVVSTSLVVRGSTCKESYKFHAEPR